MVERARVARYGAPLAFLAAVTVGVLIVRAGLDDGSNRSTPAPPPPAPARSAPQPAGSPGRFYRVRPGDTLAAIAPRFGLTEAKIIVLNPGIEPTALHVGQRIRVR